ncbi:MAG: penicillin-binding protein 1C [Flavobacteriales bacterium]|nr:penicillin-binding protein 1C [Flavobacteriales bacterium]
MNRWRRVLLGAVVAVTLLFTWARWGPMDPLFDKPRSTVLLDRDGNTLAATVARDGQWRMPPGDSVPRRFEQCLIAFEDRHFRSHPGIHLPSLVRAARQNRDAGRVVSGGSTITMQLARMARGDRPRTWWNKAVEMALALRLEVRYSKDAILALYAANAPFGGNVVGLEAAAWRWYGRPPERLGWAECATLAVLPNAPARIHPGRRRDELRRKRDRLLSYLRDNGTMDSMACQLAKSEPLPDRPLPLPLKATHLLTTLEQQGHSGTRIHSTIDAAIHQRVTAIAERHAPVLRANEVYNAAVLVLDTRSGEVLAYLGNLASAGPSHAGAVDIIRARRSTGSLLKPFLFAAMLQSGELMPDQLVADLPTQYEGFAPRNFVDGYDGAVPASQALARSLNVPAVRALHRHGIERTLHILHGMGLHSIDGSADHYGLSLIVGGAESSLWELTGAYASMARILLNEDAEQVHAPKVTTNEAEHRKRTERPPLNPAAIHHTFQALQSLNRPDLEIGWQHFAGQERIAWKTGTSFGHRDAWAVGVTERYTVGVWTGNADGEGRPGLTGSLAAAPILFEVFGTLPDGLGFDPPHDDLMPMAVCRSSGLRASVDCVPVDTIPIIRAAIRTPPCTYHQRVFVDASETEQLVPGAPGHWVSWFVLPPAMEHYYAAMHPGYRRMPPAPSGNSTSPMELIYPENAARLHIPIRLDGSFGQVVLHAAHRDPGAVIDWDLDGAYIGRTADDHRLQVSPGPGPHRLTLTDQHGRTLSARFQCVRGSNDRPNE